MSFFPPIFPLLIWTKIFCQKELPSPKDVWILVRWRSSIGWVWYVIIISPHLLSTAFLSFPSLTLNSLRTYLFWGLINMKGKTGKWQDWKAETPGVIQTGETFDIVLSLCLFFFFFFFFLDIHFNLLVFSLTPKEKGKKVGFILHII